MRRPPWRPALALTDGGDMHSASAGTCEVPVDAISM
jgi:hypothetical protein